MDAERSPNGAEAKLGGYLEGGTSFSGRRHMSRFKEVIGVFYSGLLFVAAMKSVDEMAVFLVEVRKSRALSNKMCICRLE
ncbi:hypothetical protein DS893_05775 [Vibrionales bacterium C3R12]|nr:hypothetical protein DS893_05775 [Vibrionales bacterium C3R12]